MVDHQLQAFLHVPLGALVDGGIVTEIGAAQCFVGDDVEIDHAAEGVVRDTAHQESGLVVALEALEVTAPGFRVAGRHHPGMVECPALRHDPDEFAAVLHAGRRQPHPEGVTTGGLQGTAHGDAYWANRPAKIAMPTQLLLENALKQAPRSRPRMMISW